MDKHLFFDLDRTLWDFERNSKHALQEIYESLSLHQILPPFGTFHYHYQKKNGELWRKYGKGKITKEKLRTERFHQTLKTFQIEHPELVSKIAELYVQISPRQTLLFPGAIETLTALKNDGYLLHIITNGFKEVQHIKLEQSKLQPFFEIILCSEEVGKNKPALEVFQHALQSSGAKPMNSIMIGDDLQVDILGAERAGMQSILFDPENFYRNYSGHKVQQLNEIPEKLPWMFK